MKKTYIKVIVRTIKHSLSRFLAIFAIVALGVGFLAGLLAATPDMRYSADKYFDETNLFDLRIISTLGLTSDDVDFLKSYSGTKEIMPAQSKDLYLNTKNGATLIANLHGLPIELMSGENKGYLNQVVLVEGRLPENKYEVLVEQGAYGAGTIALGDKLVVSADNESIEDVLNVNEFTICGIVKSSYYFSYEREPSSIGNGTTDIIVYADINAFSAKQYSEIYITLNGASELNSLEKEYVALTDNAKKYLENNSDEAIKRRYNEIMLEAAGKLNDAKKEFAEKKLDAEQQLDDAKKELNDAEQKLTDGEKKYNSSVQELSDAQKTVSDGQAQLAAEQAALPERLAAEKAKLDAAKLDYEKGVSGLAQLNEGINTAQAQLNMVTAQIPLASQAKASAQAALEANPTDTALQQALVQAVTAEQTLIATLEAINAQLQPLLLQSQEITAQLNAAKTQIEAGENALAQAPAQAQTEFIKAENLLISAQIEIDDARVKLNDAKIELADARVKLADGQAKYEDAKTEADEKLADGQIKLDEAQNDIDDIALPEWYVLGRDTNVSFATFDSNISKIEAIAQVFPVFFFLVAALVALTTMTRMVEEERLQIGTIKALGYSRKTIAVKYTIYAFLATALGCVVGLLIGFNLFPRIIWGAYGMMYNLPALVCQFNVKYAIIATVAALGCTLAATANACWSTLNDSPANLILPRAPKAGKRIFLEKVGFIWKRLKFTHKVTARNLFRYKKRFFMTVIGIAGCTALLVTGFGLRDSISDIIYKQFDNIFLYDMSVAIKNEEAINSEQLSTVLNDKSIIEQYITISEEKSNNTFNGEVISTYILVPNSLEEMPKFFDLHERKSKKTIVLGNEGVVLTEKLATRAGLTVGQEIALVNKDNQKASFTITGIVENYVENYVYLSESEYTRGFKQSPKYTSVYGTLASADVKDTAANALLKVDDVNTVSFISNLRQSFDDMLKNITVVVYVLIVSAAALAFVVLYNLTNINITEREKEIATIKVLGFYDKEVSAYVYRESVMLSLIGTSCGLFCGMLLHQFVIRTAEVDAVMFGRIISPQSYLISAALTLFFATLVNLVMNFKLRKISMVESMKAPE